MPLCMVRLLAGAAFFCATSFGAWAAPAPDGPRYRPPESAPGDLRRLKLLATNDPPPVERLWQLWQEFRLYHSGSPEYVQAAEIMSRIRSPLDNLDARKIPSPDRFAWQPPELVAILGEHRGRHDGQSVYMEMSPDGQWVASSSWDGLWLRDVATLGRKKAIWKSVQRRPIAFGSSSRSLLTSLGDSKAQVWELKGGDWQNREIFTVRLPAVDGPRKGIFESRHFLIGDNEKLISPDGKILVVYEYTHRKISIWDWHEKRLTRRTELNESYDWPGVLSSDGKLLALVTWKEELQLWDVSVNPPHLEAKVPNLPGTTQSLSFARDGKSVLGVLCTSRGYTLYLWTRSSEVARKLKIGPQGYKIMGKLPFRPRKACLLPDATAALISCHDGTLHLWDLTNNAERDPLTGPIGAINALAFSPDDTRLAVQESSTDDGSSYVRIWDLTGVAPHQVYVFQPHRRCGGQVAYSPDGKVLLTTGTDSEQSSDPDTLRIWRITGNRLSLQFEKVFPMDQILGLAISPDGRRVAVACLSQLQDDSDLPPLPKRLRPPPDTQPRSPCAKGVVHLFDMTGRLPKHFTDISLQKLPLGKADPDEPPFPHEYDLSHFHAVSFTPDSCSLMIDTGVTIRLWRLSPGKAKEIVGFAPDGGALNGATVSPDGKIVVTSGHVSGKLGTRLAGKLGFWDTRNTPPVCRRVLTEPGTMIRHALFSKDGRLMAYEGRKLTLLDVRKGIRLKQWDLPGSAGVMAFSSSSRYLAVGNGNGTVYIFRLAPCPSQKPVTK